MENKVIYLDNASTTPLKKEVLDKMLPYLTEYYGNANSVHAIGRQAVNGLDLARETVAEIIGADFNEVYFTSGGTESNNFAIRGAFIAGGGKKTAVTSSIEHPSVLTTLSELEKQGVKVTKINPNVSGILSVSDYQSAINSDTFIACMMTANNEIGTYQPIKEFSSACAEKGVISFSDCVQAMGDSEINVKKLGVDMLSFSAHKFGGPKGVGVLYVKNKVKIAPIISGGHQERLKRGGTSNVAGAVGLATALKISRENLKNNREKVSKLRDLFIDRILSEVDGTTLNGDREVRLSGNANITFNGVSGEALLFKLDLKGVCASLGSACSAGTIEPSYVLKSIGLTDTEARSTIRFSIGEQNTLDEINRAVEIIKSEVNGLSK